MDNKDMPASPVIDHNGEPLKVVVIGQDDPDNKGFSFTNEMNCIGLTKLEYFAAKAMQGLCANPNVDPERDGAFINEKAREIALGQLATLAELEKQGG